MANHFDEARMANKVRISQPIPKKPEDDLFPKDWGGINDFCRALAMGGDVTITNPPTKNPSGVESVVFKNVTQQAVFLVTRMDERTYIVKRT